MEMTKEWIRNYNQKCAEFIGAYFCDDDKKEFPNGYWLIDDYYRELPLYLNQFKFHSDWNWIHEVIDKIIKIPDGIGYQFKRSIEGCFDSKKEVIQAIDKFIDWYNKQKES